MDELDFRKDFLENVNADAASSGTGRCAAFVYNMATYLVEAEVLLDFVPAYYEGRGARNRLLRVDGYYQDELDGTMNLIVAEYDGYLADDVDVFGKTQLTLCQNRVSSFVEEALANKIKAEMSMPYSDLIDTLRREIDEINKFRILIFTDSKISKTIKSIDAVTIAGKPAECQIWDIERVFRVCASATGKQIIEVDFKKYTADGIPCIEASDAVSDEYKGYLCIISGETLANIYDAYGSALLEGNVRSFLSTKVAVNKKIRQTILGNPDRFFAYNNGVSATALDVTIENTPRGKYIVSARDFQIINGGQTTASLSNARHKDKANLSSIYVQMKLTQIGEMEPDKQTDLVRNISRSSNSQNKVSDADFFATHPFHVEMENISKRMYAPAVAGAQYETIWFYERARGQYLQAQMRLTPAQKKKFLLQHPKKQVITKTDLAKVRNSWDGYPHLVSKGAQTNFVKYAESIDAAWQESSFLFNDKYYTDSVALMIMYKHLEELIPKQEWYESGYRANVVTYTMALFHKLLKAQFPGYELDLQQIWGRQSVPEPVTKVFIELTKRVYDVITDEHRETINVTQWCKREKCWKNVQCINVKLPSTFSSLLTENKVSRMTSREVKMDQKVISNVEAQSRVVRYSAAQWRRVYSFAKDHKMMDADDIKAINIAMKLPTKVPTADQSNRLLRLLERIELEGFNMNP